MLIYGRSEIRPNEGAEINEYVVPLNISMELESIIFWSNSDGQFNVYKNGSQVGDIRLSEFHQSTQTFFNEGLAPLDVISVYASHGQVSNQALSCTFVLKQL